MNWWPSPPTARMNLYVAKESSRHVGRSCVTCQRDTDLLQAIVELHQVLRVCATSEIQMVDGVLERYAAISKQQGPPGGRSQALRSVADSLTK